MDIGALVGHGWNTFKANPGPFIIATVVVLVANAALGFAGNFLPFMLGAVVSVSVSGLAVGALSQMGLKGSRGQNVELSDLAVVMQSPVDFIVVGLAISVGVIGCCVGLFATQALFSFAMFLVLSGVGYQDALSRSLAVTRERFTDMLLLMLVLFVLNFAGFLLCGIGLVVSIPVGFIALAKAFDDSGLGASGGQGAMVTPPPPQQSLP